MDISDKKIKWSLEIILCINDNTISKNHLIFISNIPFNTFSIFGIISKVKGKVELTKENVYVTIRLLIKPVSKEKGRASK